MDGWVVGWMCDGRRGEERRGRRRLVGTIQFARNEERRKEGREEGGPYIYSTSTSTRPYPHPHPHPHPPSNIIASKKS